MMEHDDEPVPGLPGELPTGERILWQGAPNWRVVARRVFWLRAVSWYFALLALWRGLSLYGLVPNSEAISYGLAILPVAMAAIAVLCLLAWLTARSTVYTITNRRVVMRFGVALPLTINVPFKSIGSIDLRRFGDGSGDIPLAITDGGKFAYTILWPHAKPWAFRAPQPMMRGLSDVEEPARVLAHACAEFHEEAGDDMPEAKQQERRIGSVTPAPKHETTGFGSVGHA